MRLPIKQDGQQLQRIVMAFIALLPLRFGTAMIHAQPMPGPSEDPPRPG